MEPAKVLLKSTDYQHLVGTAAQAALNLFADDQVLGIEHARVNQFERAAPMLFGLFVGRLLGDEHRVHKQCLVGALRVHAQMADVVRVIDDNAVGKDEMHQGGVQLRAPTLGRQDAD